MSHGTLPYHNLWHLPHFLWKILILIVNICIGSYVWECMFACIRELLANNSICSRLNSFFIFFCVLSLLRNSFLLLTLASKPLKSSSPDSSTHLHIHPAHQICWHLFLYAKHPNNWSGREIVLIAPYGWHVCLESPTRHCHLRIYPGSNHTPLKNCPSEIMSKLNLFNPFVHWFHRYYHPLMF